MVTGMPYKTRPPLPVCRILTMQCSSSAGPPMLVVLSKQDRHLDWSHAAGEPTFHIPFFKPIPAGIHVAVAQANTGAVFAGRLSTSITAVGVFSW